MAAVSVLVVTSDPGPALPHLVRSVDAQTLAAAEFELIVVDASNDGSTARLHQLAGRRPNVTVLSPDAPTTDAFTAAGPTAHGEGGGVDRLGTALERATGQYVLVITQQQRLAPRALELLLERARRTDADLVLGRAVTATASGSVALPDDVDRFDLPGIAETETETDLTGCVALVRRSLVAGRTDAGTALLDLPALAVEAVAVSAVGRYACAVQEADPSGSTDVSLQSPTYRWSEGTLQLTVGVQLPEPASPAVRAWLVVTRGLAEIALPATTGTDERSGATVTVTADLDPRTVQGGPLDDGVWDLLLRLAWPGREVTLPLTSGPTRSAVIAGRPYAVRAANRAVHLDVGATLTSVIGAVPQARTSLAESVHGTLVTLDYPDLHVHGDAILDARLLLDGFTLPGRLVAQDGRARLQAYASSLAGVSTVRVVAGGGRPVPTGLRLRVDGTGGMAFEKVPAPTPKPTPPPASAGGVSLVQRLRRRLPGAVEPVVHRLATVPVLRQAYRRLINR